MFERVNVPILGVVENMAYIPHPDKAGEKIQMFPKGDLHSYIDSKKLKLIVEIPMLGDIAMASEMGIPYTAQKSGDPVSNAYKTMAQNITAQI